MKRLCSCVPHLTFALLVICLFAAAFPRAGLGASDRPKCDVCARFITGKYYTGESLTVCDACYKRYPKCPGCQMPVIKSGGVQKENKVCADCARHAGKCSVCDDVLLGLSYRPQEASRSDQYCASCFETRSRCALCDMPGKDLTKSGEKFACPFCLKKANRCSTCQEPILGQYYTIEERPGVFCQVCFEEGSHCSLCARPVGKGGRVLSDARVSCAECASDAVRSYDDALDLMAAAVRFIEDDLHFKVSEPFDFILVDNSQMRALTGGNGAPGKMKELGFFSSRVLAESPRSTIAILSDLPRVAFMETVAHEYAHLWQFSRRPGLKEKQVVEGFAQWVAAKWLSANHLDSPLSRLEGRRDAVYGDGYRIMQMIAFRHRRGDPARAVAEHVVGESALGAAPARGVSTKPLSQLLTRATISGPKAFLRAAVVVEPDKLRARK